MKKINYIILAAIVMLSACHNGSNLKNKIEGKVKKDQIAIAPKVPGRILKIYVNESDIVKEGDTLALLDMPDIEAKLLQVEGAYISAKAQYEMALNGATQYERKQIEAKYAADYEQYLLAEKSFSRIKQMFNDSLIATQKYDEVLAKYNASKAQLDATLAQKNDIANGVRKEKIEMALGDMKRAEGAYKEVLTAFNERYIIAPKDMTIESITLKAGELLLPGYNFIIGCELDGIYFRFTINEKKIGKYEKDKTYNVEVPDSKLIIPCKLTGIKQLAGYANKTSSFANYELGEAVYELKLVPEDYSIVKNIYVNMTVLLEEEK
ncbi:MAG: hypothetical protein AUJ97_08115 [Bacteroidetes bacterium CG2_30_32_10]|nr:MAG: hypothetical protein AUJ97_08115 [Bacteroidetes bacterium CG2_30_32_10]